MSMLKDGYEDYIRHKKDKEENNRKALVYDKASDNFKMTNWQDLKVSDIVKVEDQSEFPADLLIIASEG